MTLQQLRYFLATVDHGLNISRAADSVDSSQPALSKQIRLLEQQLGSSLFSRASTRITGLTDSGMRVCEAARRILREADGLTQLGHDLMNQESGKLTISALHTYALALLPKAMSTLRRRYPGVAFEIRQDSPGHMVELVRAGVVDLGVSMEVPEPRDGVIGFPFLQVRRVLLTPRKHPLLRKENVTLEDIVRYPIVAQTGLSAGGWAISKVFKSSGFNVEYSVLASDASLIKAYVAQGLGLAIMSTLLIDTKKDVDLGVIDVSHIFQASNVTLLMDPYKYQRGYVHDFIEMLAPEWTRARITEAVAAVVPVKSQA